MVKVENKETLHLLAKRFIRNNRGRNRIAILSIMLRSILFTSVFTASFSMIKSTRDSEIRQAMNSSHASIDNMTKDEFNKVLEAVKIEGDVVRYGIGNFLRLVVSEELKAHQTEVRYADNNMVESFLCAPTKGSLPEKENEIACSTITLDLLGIPHKLGEKVTIKLDGHDQIYTDTFVLSGFWQGDAISMSQLVWVSKPYMEKVCHDITRQEVDKGIYEGIYTINVWYNNTWQLNQKTEGLTKASGIDEADCSFKANPAYILFQEDAFPVASVCLILLIIMLAGYLIIYNVFNISVNVDIKAYGLLKNIGTTGRQLKKIVRMQAFWLSAIGIPLGLLLGYVIGIQMMPTLMRGELGNPANAVTISISINPLIFLGAALFSFITVYAGCIRPCRIVESVSPAEAIKMTDVGKGRKKYKKNTSASPIGMAFANVRRTFGKGLIVMISIALSLIAFNSIFMIVEGFDFKEYVSVRIQSDFAVSQLNDNFTTSNLNGISPEFRSMLDTCPYSKQNGYIYFTSMEHEMDDVLYQNYKDMYGETEKYMHKSEKLAYEENVKNKKIQVHLIGLNQGVFEKLEFKDEKCNWEEFQTGRYIVADFPLDSQAVKYYSKGDKVMLEYEDKRQESYEVLGEAAIPYALDYPFYDRSHITLFIPESEYIKNTGNEYAMRATVDANKGKEGAVEQYIQKQAAEQHETLVIDSILSLRKEFADYLNKYYLIGGMLTAVLAFIGIMNYFNTSATSILSRKKELSLLEVVGMTKKQIKTMLIIEGSIYLMGAFLIAAAAIVLISEKLITSVGLAYFFHMKVTLLPCILTLPILFIIAYAIPTYNYKMMNRETIVERLRNE